MKATVKTSLDNMAKIIKQAKSEQREIDRKKFLKIYEKHWKNGNILSPNEMKKKLGEK